jgi:hypothetical protein
MAQEASRRGGKTETLTIRLDPKTRFVLEYMSRLRGQTITTVVERALYAAAERETIPDGIFGGEVDWKVFWDVSDGVRALQLSRRSEFFPTYEEEKRLAFTQEHWPFFYSAATATRTLRPYIDILWPRIDEFVQIHDDAKQDDYFAAGLAMQKALNAAKLKAPDWPIKEQKNAKPDKVENDDSEIPF